MGENEKKRSFFPKDKDLLFRIGIGAVAVLLLIGIVVIATHLINSKVDTTQGRSLLNKLNGEPVSTIKAEIKELEKSEAEAEAKRKNQSAAQRFADTVIMGDGSIQGLADYCNLTRVLSVEKAEVSGVEKDATASLSVQTKTETPAVSQQPVEKPASDAGLEDEEVVEDGIHNNYGIVSRTGEEKVYAGDPLKLDTTYGNPGGTTTDEYGYEESYGYDDTYGYEEPSGYYDPDTGEFIYEESADAEGSQESPADKTINSQMITAIKANPSKLFLAYGYNDLTTLKGDVNAFIESYKTVLGNLQEKLPDCDIYVLSILAPRKEVQEEKKEFESREEFNEQLAALCRVMHVTFIDNEELVNSSDYSEDGVTFTETFYPRVLERLEEIGDL